MKIRITFLCLLLVMASWMLSGCQKRISTELTVQPITPKDYNHVLPPGKLALRKITDPAQIPDYTLACSDTDRLREAIANSLNYLAKPSSKQHYPYGDIPYEQAVKSLRELDRLVAMRLPPREMNSVLRERFDTYISVGCDDQGTVLFTGYYTPIFDGSSTRTDRFRHPLYKPPADLIKGADGAILGRKGSDGRVRPYPSRAERRSKEPISSTAMSSYGSAIRLRFISRMCRVPPKSACPADGSKRSAMPRTTDGNIRVSRKK